MKLTTVGVSEGGLYFSYSYRIAVLCPSRPLWFYAVDIALVAENDTALQTMLDTLFKRCCKLHLMIDNSKSAIVRFRKTKKGCTKSEFNLGSKSVKTVSQYKYYGVILDENIKFDACAQTLSSSADRALAKLISKFKCQKKLSYKKFTKLYDTCAWPILDYCSSIWSYQNCKYSDRVQNRAIRYYLGLHHNAPQLGYQADIGWILPKYRYYKSSIRL